MTKRLDPLPRNRLTPAEQVIEREVFAKGERPASGRIAVKVINHLGDEVMKVFRVRERQSKN